MARVVTFRNLSVVSLLAVVALLVVFARGSDTAEAATFTPTYSVDLSDSTVGVNADIIEFFSIAAPDAFFGRPDPVLLTPEDPAGTTGWATPGYSSVAIGADVGASIADATLGLLNGPCAAAVPVPFAPMTKATIDDSTNDGDVDGPADDDWPGYGDGTLALAPGGPAGFGGTPDGLADADTIWPLFLDSIAPQATTGAPLARLHGQVLNLAGIVGTHVSLELLIYPDNGALSSFGGPAAGDDVYPMLVVLENTAIGSKSAPSTVTDVCTSLDVFVTRFGESRDNSNTPADESGTPIWTNPSAAATLTFSATLNSIPDADGDGLDNSLDTCPFVTNTEDPRASGAAGDPDGDGIDSACDPDPASPCGPGEADDILAADCDADGFFNRDDRCPLVPDTSDADTDGDSIGDVCDLLGAGGFGLGPSAQDGTTLTASPSDTVTVSAVHDVEIRRLSGQLSTKVNASKGYSLKLRNNGPTTIFGPETYPVLIAVGAVSGCDKPNIDTDFDGIPNNASPPFGIDQDVTGDGIEDAIAVTAATIASGSNGTADFDVLYGSCPVTSSSPPGTDFTPVDYVMFVDVCHRGDPAPLGFFGGACPGFLTSDTPPGPFPFLDGGVDSNIINDQQQTFFINNKNFFVLP